MVIVRPLAATRLPTVPFVMLLPGPRVPISGAFADAPQAFGEHLHLERFQRTVGQWHGGGADIAARL